MSLGGDLQRGLISFKQVLPAEHDFPRGAVIPSASPLPTLILVILFFESNFCVSWDIKMRVASGNISPFCVAVAQLV